MDNLSGPSHQDDGNTMFNLSGNSSGQSQAIVNKKIDTLTIQLMAANEQIQTILTENKRLKTELETSLKIIETYKHLGYTESPYAKASIRKRKKPKIWKQDNLDSMSQLTTNNNPEDLQNQDNPTQTINEGVSTQVEECPSDQELCIKDSGQEQEHENLKDAGQDLENLNDADLRTKADDHLTDHEHENLNTDYKETEPGKTALLQINKNNLINSKSKEDQRTDFVQDVKDHHHNRISYRKDNNNIVSYPDLRRVLSMNREGM